MTQNSRALTIWMDITWAVLPLLAMLSILLGWAPVVQIALTVLAGAAVFGTRIALTRRAERRVRRDARRRIRAARGRSELGRSRS